MAPVALTPASEDCLEKNFILSYIIFELDKKIKQKKRIEEFPSKYMFHLRLILKFFFSRWFFVVFASLTFFILLGLIPVRHNEESVHQELEIIFINSFSIAISIFFVYVWIQSFRKRKKKYSMCELCWAIVLLLSFLTTGVFATLNFVFTFFDYLLLVVFMPVIVFLIDVIQMEFFRILNFARRSYTLLSAKNGDERSESYELFCEANLRIDQQNDNQLYVLINFALFILKMAIAGLILFFAYHFVPTFWELPDLIVIIIRSVSATLVIIQFVLYVFSRSIDWMREAGWVLPRSIPVVTLIILVLLHFIYTDALNYVAISQTMSLIFIGVTIFIIFLQELEAKNRLMLVIDDTLSEFPIENDEEFDEADLVMIDEPIDNIKHINEVHKNDLDKLHSILENTTRVPLVISLKGEWGSGKSSIAATLSVQLSKINRYSYRWFYANDKYKKRYFTLNVDLMKFDSALELNNYIYGYLKALSRIYMTDIEKNVDAYFKNILDILSNADKKLSFLEKITQLHSHKNFLKIEDIRFLFQRSITRLLGKSGREGIVIFIDDIDRLVSENDRKIYALLKEFFNVYGFKIIILNGHKRNKGRNVDEEFELQKFINVEHFVGSHRGYADEKMIKLLSISARIVTDKSCKAADENEFFFLDKMLCYTRFSEIFKVYDKHDESTDFVHFVNGLCCNPRDLKKILRLAVLERKSIIGELFGEYRKMHIDSWKTQESERMFNVLNKLEKTAEMSMIGKMVTEV